MRLFLACLLLVGASNAHAGLIEGSFAGVDDSASDPWSLAGSFYLDADAPFPISGSVVRSGTLVSPLQTIAGTYGDYEFSGVARLEAVDSPAETIGIPASYFEHWILRATVSSDMLADFWMTGLNIGTMAIGTDYDYLSIYAPPISGFEACAVLPCAQPFWRTPTYWYTATFSDGSFREGHLTSLTQVPEPGTLLLLSSALGLSLLRKKRRA